MLGQIQQFKKHKSEQQKTQQTSASKHIKNRRLSVAQSIKFNGNFSQYVK